MQGLSLGELKVNVNRALDEYFENSPKPFLSALKNKTTVITLIHKRNKNISTSQNVNQK